MSPSNEAFLEGKYSRPDEEGMDASLTKREISVCLD